MMRYFIMITFSILLWSCGGDDLSQREQLNQYIAENNITNLDSLELGGFWYIINTPGGDEKPTVNNTVNVSYNGYYVDGDSFDANSNATFPLSNVIEGWQLGIPLIGRGGSIKLIIPPHYAYGPNPQNDIRRNALLVFDVELFDFQ